jgi:hypothetical protein
VCHLHPLRKEKLPSLRKEKLPSRAGPGSDPFRPAIPALRPLPIRTEARRAASKAKSDSRTPRKRSALCRDPKAVPLAKLRDAFTGLIRNGAYGGGEGFCIENPLTPTGWSRRIADVDSDLDASFVWSDLILLPSHSVET